MAEGISDASKENVLIQAGACAVVISPALGGKIASITVRGTELLQPPLRTPAPRTQTMGFEESDASGWDECLPSVAACTVKTAAGEAHVPDHGDLWRVVWQVIEGNEGSRAVLKAKCFSLPLELERSITLSEQGKGWLLDIKYRLTNTGSVRVPWSWAAHPLFLAEAGDRIILPESIHTLRLEGSGGGRLGAGGDAVAWPLANLASGGTTDLSRAEAPDSGIGDKLFAGPLLQQDAWCVLERPKAGVRIKVSFDADATPYLGLWICYGGWPDGQPAKQTCVAMEPATAPVDSLAVRGSWTRELGPGEWSVWSMGVEIQAV